ncbi:hypothetical protein [Paraburkholderia rhizosphaerae]|uniref:Uncharacterized protein n=1 Tax=Paraburkholderia rhizosphaerae TaxID=480658 RepID=A0A4V3HEP2_9BURK|nr:hypothetical protein [Paraburkholderia rhizosphaerae]TDY49751.1 hypothetical protein BX592_1102 [Paraburkholderia rhizosphaerae]
MKLVFLALTFLCVSRCALACGEHAEEIAIALKENIQAAKNSVNFVRDFGPAYVCKTWPQRSDLTIIAVPYRHAVSEKFGNMEYFGLMLAVVNERRNIVLGKLDEPRLEVVDAIIPTGVKIDTADYKVSPSLIAFGIEVMHQNYSVAAPFYGGFMNLYVLDGRNLRKIVNGMRSYQRNSEGDDHCYPNEIAAKTIVSIGKSKSHGYFDLNVRNTRSFFSRKWDHISCKDVEEKIDSRRFVVKYDGRIYNVPEPLKAILD